MINLITDLISFTQPTNLDRESLSVIESIAKIKTKVNECINEFNNLENKTNEDYNNFRNEINSFKTSIQKICEDLTKDNNSFKNEFKEIIKALENFNVTLEIINKQCKYIQDLAKINQDNIDKGTIATRNEIIEINTSLEEKAKEVDLQTQKARIDTFTSLAEGSTTGDAELIDGRNVNGKTYTNIGGAIRAISSGEGIKIKSITPNKTSFIEVNDVIELKNKLIDGLLNTTNGTINTTDTNNKYTQFINISNYIGKYIVSSVPCIACFYTSDKNFISGLGNLNGGASRQVPNNATYIVIGMTNSNYNYGVTNDGGIIIEFFDTPQTNITQTTYKQEKRELKGINVNFDYVKNFKMSNGIIKNNAISKDAVRIENVDFIVKDSNYIIFTDYLKPGVLDYNTGIVTEGGDTEYYSTQIYVGDKQEKYIIGCSTIKVAFFDDYGNYITGFANLNGIANRKIPNNAVFAVFGLSNQNYNYSISNYNKVGVQISNKALTTTYTSFKDFRDNKLKNIKIDYNDIVNISDNILDTDFYKYIFNKGICIGDSITEGYRETMVDKYKLMSYPYYLSKFLNCEVENGGESGATCIRWWSNNFSKYNYANYNFAVIKLGQNAGLTDTLDVDVTGNNYTAYADTNTGDYCKIIEGIKAQNPNIKIFLVTIQSLDTNVNNTTNKVIKEIANKYNLPIIDLDEQPLNLRNNKYHCNEEGTFFGVHYNTIGYMTLAKIISKDIKKHILDNFNSYKNLTF